MKYSIVAYPYARQYGVIEVPDHIPEEDIDVYIAEHWGEIKFEEPDLDYTDTDFIKKKLAQ